LSLIPLIDSFNISKVKTVKANPSKNPKMHIIKTKVNLGVSI
jgi:hypothetical protein